MFHNVTRRDFVSRTCAFAGAGLLASGGAQRGKSATTKGPHDFVIVEGHRDIWEQSGRTRLKEEAQRWPLANFIVPRLIEGGVSVVIMPAGGDSPEERDEQDEMLEGSMRVLDLILSDIDKAGNKASIIRTKADVPTSSSGSECAVYS